MREECKHFQSRTYSSGEVARFCVLGNAPDQPWNCPENCPTYEKRMADVGWSHGSLVDPPAEEAPEGVSAEDRRSVLEQADEIVNAVINGPTSCMSKTFNIRCNDGSCRHPYEVYDPEYGWHMAVRLRGDDVVGRALCNENDDAKYFVRSYKKDPDGGYSYADEVLEAWLKDQGVEKIDSWYEVAARMMYYEVRGTFLMPYLDGCNHQVILGHVDGVMRVLADSDGEYDCDNTSGTAEGCNRAECEDCGDRHDEDDGYWVGPYEDRRVGPCCIDNYRYGYGRNGSRYFIEQDSAVWVESCDEYYDINYLSDNNIVELVNGDYEDIDHAVEIDGDWYHADDDDVCWDEYNARHELVDNCVNTEDLGMVHRNDAWQCNHTHEWYSDNVEWVEFEGERYHPDHVPTNETNE